MQKKRNRNFVEKKVAKFFFSLTIFFWGGGGGGNHLKHVEMQKKNSNIVFKMAAIAAILDFGPSPKFNGMILGPYLTPPT